MPKSIYLHIPFCEHICHYCDFNKVFLKGQPVDEYIDMVDKELSLTLRQVSDPEPIDTIYIGGGTPTALSAVQLERLLQTLHRHFQIGEVEWTVEVNPGGVDDEKLAVLKKGGVNRLSIGAQTFDSGQLKAIGRTHLKEDVLETIARAKKIGFTNLSVDLMFGLPQQTVESFTETLIEAVHLDVQHFSAYSLKVEEKTVFYNMQRKGKLQLPPEEAEVKMYDTLREVMGQHQFHQYEISNFAKSGFESKHNLTYWNNEEYYGFGAGAHGYVNGVRHVNAGPVTKYISALQNGKLPYTETHLVTTIENIEEFMFMGLRKRKGISKNEFKRRYGQDMMYIYSKQIEKLMEQGLLTEDGDFISLTEKGIFISNEIFEQFLCQ
ncbi:radical SAM family heme chaperone HemW [Bacillus alkalicellulosilyticus]|uniref:radical SAM family heme chaperone HemW n=1 Tax=Alkalihalobacterium alkalicellulosilyticum TaxID=1912214 RepID=UPI000996FA45|nr:radical SAM family heme chaperone HemW [Bacillus alkalicellulosilyticus]